MTIGTTWTKSSYSGTEGGNCVEVAAVTWALYVRDSKVAEGPRLALSPAAWAAFLAGAQGA